MRPSKRFIIVYVLHVQTNGSRLYFYNLKFEIFDAIVFSACLCSTHW